jgi:hypothetical protein
MAVIKTLFQLLLGAFLLSAGTSHLGSNRTEFLAQVPTWLPLDPYSYKKGTHMKYQNFNPDFFIKKSNQILVVEIKSDQEDSDEARAKLRDSKLHFIELNRKQSDLKYLFFMIGPSDYENFFIALSADSMIQYESTLMERLV